MRLAVVIPALNEQMTIADVIGRVPRDVSGIAAVSVLVVDDGSTDRTRTLAEAAGAEVVSHSRNKGVGAAFHTGVDWVIQGGYDCMVNVDGDGQFNPEDMRMLLAPIVSGEADFVTASRFKDPSLCPTMPRVKYYGNKMMSMLISRLCGTRFYDVSCGFRAYSREALLNLNLFGEFTYTQETFLDLQFKGLCMREVPVPVRGSREYGTSRVASNILKYAVRTSKIIFRAYRDYKPMQLFGFFAAILMVMSLGFGLFLAVHFALTGAFTPHKWAGFSSGALLAMAVLLFLIGLVTDMLARVRMNQERILYRLKKLRLPFAATTGHAPKKGQDG